MQLTTEMRQELADALAGPSPTTLHGQRIKIIDDFCAEQVGLIAPILERWLSSSCPECERSHAALDELRSSLRDAVALIDRLSRGIGDWTAEDVKSIEHIRRIAQ